MRLACTAIFICLSCSLFAQEAHSLLWEISGNKLEKTSYLYGTMHVSKKIAFRLDDVFYEALEESDFVALESDPASWLANDIQGNSGGFGFNYGFDTSGFYVSSFLLESPGEQEMAGYLAFEDRFVNNILYRTNEYDQNFEEDTYLDMFIYQAGAKYGKPVIALEDLEESSTLVARASRNAVKRKPDEWLRKKMQGQDVTYLMQDAYRERNIALLDSIDRAMYTEYYRQNMLYLRNEKMVEKLDSIIRTGKLFAGIGAAHLPGEKGVINLLRQKGYTLKPLVSKASDYGQRLKSKMMSKVRPARLQRYSPEDQSFSMMLPEKLYPVKEDRSTVYVSPDLANGSYVMVNRIPSYSFLKPEGQISIEDIEGLLFENIPGKILEKSSVMRNGFPGLDLKNELKNGDVQRYQIYVTPLEILIIKMSGEDDYVARYSDTVFNSLELRPETSRKLVLSSDYKDFSVQVPANYSYPNPSRIGNRMIEAYNPETGGYFFLRKASLNDFNALEEDSFELQQIQKRFYQDLGVEATYEAMKHNSQRSAANLKNQDGKQISLMASFNRGEYYLLGAVTETSEEAEAYFDSFEIREPEYPDRFETIRDTALLFSTVSPVKPNKFVESSNSFFSRRKKPKAYNPFTKKTTYQNNNSEAISVELNKAHDYLSFPHIDSVWALRKKLYRKKKFKIIRERQQMLAEGKYELEFTLSDSTSSRGILVKNVVYGGLLYELKAVVDTAMAPSRFVQEFYNNFEPHDTVVGKNFIKDKTADFFSALRANDSIVLKGYRFPHYEEKHMDSLLHYVSNFEFRDNTRHIQAHLIEKLGEIGSDEVWKFFEEFYGSSYANSGAQAKILQAVAERSEIGAGKKLLKLMDQDFPLVSNRKEIERIFEPFRDSLPLARDLFPDLLNYTGVAEYKLPIISLLADLKTAGELKPKTYKKYKVQLLTDARIQLKRQLARNSGAGTQRSASAFSNKQIGELLEDYALLLHPFINEREVKLFFGRLMLSRAPNVRAICASLIAQQDENLPKPLIDSLASDINSRLLIYKKLEEIDKVHLFPELFKVQEALAESAIFNDRKYSREKDEVVYLGERKLIQQNKTYRAYFFKTRSSQDYNKNFKMHIVVYEDLPGLLTGHFYKNDGYRLSDLDTDEDARAFVTEEFLLDGRGRAVVYNPEAYSGYGRLGF